MFFVILFAVFNVMAFLVYQKRKREREEDAIALVPAPTYLHPSLHHKTFPARGPPLRTAAGRARFSDELQPTVLPGTCPTRSTSSGRSAATTWGRRSLERRSF